MSLAAACFTAICTYRHLPPEAHSRIPDAEGIEDVSTIIPYICLDDVSEPETQAWQDRELGQEPLSQARTGITITLPV